MGKFQPQERAAALEKGLTRYFTGRPCKHGHVAERNAKSGECVVCSLARQAKWRRDNPEAVKVLDKERYGRYRDKLVAKAKEYREKNPEVVAERSKRWRERNRHKRAAAQMARQARKIQATPPWLNDAHNEWFDCIYQAAMNTGVHVDHIVPLNNKAVCGLHVPWNLQLMTQSANSKKSNNLMDVTPIIPAQNNILVERSAMPWNLKEDQNGCYV